nr:hypothetical protein [Tanacetum cinerariifolium]
MTGDDNHDGDHPKTSNPSPPVPQPTQQILHTVSSIKLPILKKGEYDIWTMKMEHYLSHTDYPIWQGEYDIWTMKMEHYLSHTDYPIWQVIHNGNSPFFVTTNANGMIKVLPPKTAEEIVAREKERKARTTLVMDLPEDHLAIFHKMADAKEIWEAIKSRFGGNDESKKMQKYLLKQQFEGGCKPKVSKVVMISMRIKKFHKRTKRKLQFDTKDPVGFDKTKVECFNCHKMGYFARDCRVKGNQDSRRRDVGYNGNKARDNGRRPAYQDDSKALVTIDGEDIDSSRHVEEDSQYYAIMAYSSSNSGSDNEVKSYSKTCKESYDRLKKLYDKQRDNLGDASVEITVYTLALKRLLNTQISANDKFGLGYGDYRYGSILSYKNEVLQNVFMNKEHDLANTFVNDRYAAGMHAVPPPMTGNYMPFGPDVKIDYSKFTYGQKHTLVDESDSKPSKYASCGSDSSVETTTSMPKLVEITPEDKEKPSFAFTDSVKHVKISRVNVKETGTPNHSPKVEKHDRNGHTRKGLGYAFTRKACFVCGGSNGRITGKGKIKASKLDFEDVYYVEELKHYNLFSMSQMCDKKNKVLFTDIDCLVLSPNFKFPDANQVLLKFPRQHNMYSFNIKNIDPSGDLACLFAKASIDESNKWHKRSDNGREFKNNDLIEFCGLKWIKREYSNARTPQQDRVAERKNKTLIEAARTMLADSFLPTTFWAETVNTACYVLTRVLVTKPQNMTPYELLTGKQPIISYLRPFGCHVTILNTIDQLGKFDGKSDSGFLVGYSLNSKAFRVYNLETKRVKENLYVNFLENKPNVVGKGHAWMFDLDYLNNSMNHEPISVENQANKSAGPKEANNSVGTQANDDQGANSKEIDLHEEHFVLPIWSGYLTTVKSSGDNIEKNTDFKSCEKPVSQVEQIFLKEREKLKRQEKEANVEARKENTHENQDADTNNTNLLNIVCTPLSAAGPTSAFNDGELSYPDDSLMPHLEDIYASPREGIFTDLSYDDEGVVTDFNNLETTVNVSPTLTTRIHTIHSKTQILRDPLLVVQTRSNANKNSEAHALLSQALEDESWVDAMQEELLQFQIHKGVVIRNKARLVAQRHRQEEGIDYDEVFAHVARIEAIRIFLAFASYMSLIVYQMDMKRAFWYGTIDEEVYVTQPPGFVNLKFPNKVTPKTSHLQAVKRIFKYLKGQPKLGLWYPKVSSFDLEVYSDSDYAGANLDKKSTTGDIHSKGTILTDADGVISKELASPKQTALSKDISNSFMVGSLPKTICYKLMMFGLTKDVVVKLTLLEDVIQQALHLDDTGGVECLPNEEIFIELARMGYEKPPPTCYTTCATLSQKVAQLEQDKIAQALEIFKLKKRVKKLEKKRRSKSSSLKRLRKVDAELQRRIDDVNATKDVSAAEPTVFDDGEMAKMLHDKEVEQAAAREKQEKDDLEKAKEIPKSQEETNFHSLSQEEYDNIFEEYGWKIFKKLKAVEVSGSESTQETPTNDPKEMSEEDVQNMLEIILVYEFKVKALQVKVGGITEAYQSFEDMLKGFDREDLDALWRLVKEKFNDVFWKLQRYMHDPLTWKLYTNCGVHHVSSTKRHDIFMLTEKDYPLSNAVMIMMLSAKLQVEEDSEMAKDLVMKIFMEANKP